MGKSRSRTKKGKGAPRNVNGKSLFQTPSSHAADQDETFSPAAEALAKKTSLVQSLQMQSHERKRSAEKWKQRFKDEKLEREKAERENKRLRKEILDLEQRLAEFEQRAILPRRQKVVESKARRSDHKSEAKRKHTDIAKEWVDGNFSDPEYGWGMVQEVLEQTYKDRATDGVLDAINRDLEKHMNREYPVSSSSSCSSLFVSSSSASACFVVWPLIA